MDFLLQQWLAEATVVYHILEGAEEIDLDVQKYVLYNDTCFQPFLQDGKNVYQVIAMEDN